MLKDIHNRLRPLGIADILDETIELYKSNFVPLVGIAALLWVPLFLLQSLLVEQPRTAPGKPDLAALGAWMAGLGAYGIIYLLAWAVVTVALTLAVSELYLERKGSIGEYYRRVLHPVTLFRFIGANLLVWLIVVVLCIPLFVIFGLSAVVAGLGKSAGAAVVAVLFGAVVGIGTFVLVIYVIMRLLLVPPAFIVESKGAIGSIARSWTLMKGSVWKAFAVMFIIGVVTLLIQGIAALPFGVETARGVLSGQEPSRTVTVLDTIIQTIIGTLLMPVNSIATILLYYDQRIRKEGFDLELLARDLAASSEQAGAYPALAHPQEQVQVEPQSGGEAADSEQRTLDNQ